MALKSSCCVSHHLKRETQVQVHNWKHDKIKSISFFSVRRVWSGRLHLSPFYEMPPKEKEKYMETPLEKYHDLYLRTQTRQKTISNF